MVRPSYGRFFPATTFFCCRIGCVFADFAIALIFHPVLKICLCILFGCWSTQILNSRAKINFANMLKTIQKCLLLFYYRIKITSIAKLKSTHMWKCNFPARTSMNLFALRSYARFVLVWLINSQIYHLCNWYHFLSMYLTF